MCLVEFNSLCVLNLFVRWEEVGLWNSEKGATVDIRDILWPGEALKPPEGVPERGFLSVTFLEDAAIGYVEDMIRAAFQGNYYFFDTKTHQQLF